jgi:Putative phage tail protein
MATLLFQAIGGAIAGPIGSAIGAVAGTFLDRILIGGPKVRREGPRLSDLSVQNSSYGEALPLVYGTVRVAGNIIWSSGLIERRSDQTQGGKGGSVTTTTYSYFCSFAVAIAGHQIHDVQRIWADGKLMRLPDGTLLPGGSVRIYKGDEDQVPDPVLEAAVGISNAPAHRGMAYALFEDLPLADYANRIPNLTFEIKTSAGPITLSHIFTDVLARCDIRKVNITDGLAPVQGFAVARDSSARGVLESLAPLQAVSLSDQASVLTVAPVAHAAAVHQLEDQHLGAKSGSAAQLDTGDERRLSSVTSLPGEVQLRYSDPARDYQLNMQRARRLAAKAQPRQTVDLPVVMDANAAKQTAERWLARQWRERQTRHVRLSLTHANILPGQTIAFANAPSAYWLVQSVAIEDGGITLDLLPLSSADLRSEAVADEGVSIGQAPAVHGATTGYLLDVPVIETALPASPRVFAVAAGVSAGWRRATLWLSADGGQSYAQAANLSRASVMGKATTVLGAAPAHMWDERSTVDVALLSSSMELFSRPAASVLAGSNLAILGGELFQFRSAVPVGLNHYRLSGLLRGVRGSEAAIAAHMLDEAFVLLDPLPDISVTPPLTSVGQTLLGKFLSPGQVLGDVPAFSMLFHAQALRPLAPVHGKVQLLSNGNRTLMWTRRSRAGFDWIDGVDAPLGEDSERYRVAVFVSGIQKRSWDVVQPQAIYTAADQLADGAAAGTTMIRIAQVSASIGAGADLTFIY